MPNYEFICKDCGDKFEINMGFSTCVGEVNCPKCKGKNLKRTFGVPNVIYKGEGWAGKEKKHD